MLKKILSIFIFSLMAIALQGCIAAYTNNTLDFTANKEKYPISFSSYLYNKNGEPIKVYSKELKFLKHFQFIIKKDVKMGETQTIDISDTLNKIIEKSGADGIVNLQFSKLGLVENNLLGQLVSAIPFNIGFFSSFDKNPNKTKNIIFMAAGVGGWIATKYYIKNKAIVLVRGDLVKWVK